MDIELEDNKQFILNIPRTLTLLVPNFRRHLSSLFFFNKLSLEKKFIFKVERLNVKQRRSRGDGSYELSHLDLCCLQKPIIIACGSEKVKYSGIQEPEQIV